MGASFVTHPIGVGEEDIRIKHTNTKLFLRVSEPRIQNNICKESRDNALSALIWTASSVKAELLLEAAWNTALNIP